jgi:hypothetical protein
MSAARSGDPEEIMGTRFALCLFGLVISSQLALAQDWGLNQIVSYVDLAEKRLGEGDVNSARFNLNSARDMVPKASAEAKAHKGYGEVQQRIAKLDKVIAAKEAGAAKSQEGVDKLKAAEDDELQGRVAFENEKYDFAAKYLKSCVQNFDAAVAVDASIAKSHAELGAKCKDGLVEVAKMTSGEAKDATSSEQGKLALDNLAIAEKAMAAKKLEALQAAEGIKAAAACHHNAGYLTSLYTRNRNPVWNGKKDKLGTSTIDDVYQKCQKLEKALQARPAVGCGFHYVSVSQWRASIYDKWGPVKISGDMLYKAIACAEMPKKTIIRGQAAGFKARYEQSCGKDAIYVIQHDSWLESGTQRQMSGECYKKGSIKIGS